MIYALGRVKSARAVPLSYASAIFTVTSSQLSQAYYSCDNWPPKTGRARRYTACGKHFSNDPSTSDARVTRAYSVVPINLKGTSNQ